MVNIITIFVVVIMTELVFFATQQQYTYAQIPGLPGSDNSNNPSENTASETATNNTTNSDFVTYHSDRFGYTIQYPSHWSVHEYERLNSVVISFPDKHAQAFFFYRR